MFVKKNRKRGKPLLRKRTYRKKSTSTVSKATKRYIKRALNSEIENKIVSINQTLAFGNISESPDLNLYPVLPYAGYTSIPQGVGAGSRVGNRCKVMKVLLKYVLYAEPYSQTTNPVPQPQEVQMFLLNLKQASGILPTATQLQGLVQLGSASVALSGNISDIAINSWNTDVFNVRSWTHKVGYSGYTGTTLSSPNTQQAQYFANNDFKLNVIRTMNITKMVASQIRMDDGGQTHLGKNCFFGFQCVNSNGSTAGSTILPVRINYWLDITYQDA